MRARWSVAGPPLCNERCSIQTPRTSNFLPPFYPFILLSFYSHVTVCCIWYPSHYSTPFSSIKTLICVHYLDWPYHLVLVLWAKIFSHKSTLTKFEIYFFTVNLLAVIFLSVTLTHPNTRVRKRWEGLLESVFLNTVGRGTSLSLTSFSKGEISSGYETT